MSRDPTTANEEEKGAEGVGGRRALDGCCAFRRDDQDLLVAVQRGQQAERGNLRRGVEPDWLVVDLHASDEVVECGGRGYGAVEADANADEHGFRMQAERSQHGSKQGVLVLAVAVLVVQYSRGSVGLVPANAEGDAYVTDLAGDPGVDSLRFVFLRRFAGGDFGDFGLDGFVGKSAGRHESERYHSPTASQLGKVVQETSGEAAFFGVHGLFGRERLLLFGLRCCFCDGAGGWVELLPVPGVDALVADGRLGGLDAGCGVGPDGDFGGGGDAQLRVLVEDDGVAEEDEAAPELVGRFGFEANAVRLPLYRVANAQTLDGQLLLLEVAVEGGFAA